MKVKKSILIPSLVALAALAVAGLTRPVPQPPSFCDQCVMERNVVKWQVAGRWDLFQTSSAHQTPVSELLAERKICPQHEHHWASPIYRRESELETSEAPRIISLGYLNSTRNLSFLRSVFSFTTKEDIASWHNVAWQPTLASALEPALRFSRFPENGFTSRQEFLDWWQTSAYPLFNKLNEMTVAD